MLKKRIDFKKKIRAIKKNHLSPYGISIITEILNNTANGLDKNGKKFKEYSDKYKYDILHGKHRQKKSTKVNLQSTGTMLRNVDFKPIKNGIKLYIKGNRSKGLSNNDVAYYNKLRGREFLGLPKKREQKVKKELINIYARELKN